MLVGDHVPSDHPAPGVEHPGQRGDGGQVIGIHPGGEGIGIQFIDENIGIPVFGVSGPRGIHIKVGADPGASGAQLRGDAIHDPHPNQHENPLITKSIFFEISSVISLILSKRLLNESPS